MRCALVTGVQTCVVPISGTEGRVVPTVQPAFTRHALPAASALVSHPAAGYRRGAIHGSSNATARQQERTRKAPYANPDCRCRRRCAAGSQIHPRFGLYPPRGRAVHERSEEHTSELQSLMRISYAVFCLKTKIHTIITII